MVPDWIAAVALIFGLVAGVAVGFVVGLDAAAQAFAARWLELHPDEADLTVGSRRGRHRRS